MQTAQRTPQDPEFEPLSPRHQLDLLRKFLNFSTPEGRVTTKTTTVAVHRGVTEPRRAAPRRQGNGGLERVVSGLTRTCAGQHQPRMRALVLVLAVWTRPWSPGIGAVHAGPGMLGQGGGQSCPGHHGKPHPVLQTTRTLGTTGPGVLTLRLGKSERS